MTNSPKEPNPEQREQAPGGDSLPPAGPHALDELTDKERTPGTGSLPDDTDREGDVGPD